LAPFVARVAVATALVAISLAPRALLLLSFFFLLQGARHCRVPPAVRETKWNGKNGLREREKSEFFLGGEKGFLLRKLK
jgi:hypothetical protein